MDYDIVVDWKNLKQYWCSLCESYSISHKKKKIEYKKSKTVKKYAKKLLKHIPDMKKLVKEEKKRIRGLPLTSSVQPVDRKDMKCVVKIVKLLAQVTNNGERQNWLKEEMTEAEFVARFTTPLMDLIMKPCSTKMTFKPGEQKLQIVKDYVNSALTEDKTRLPGPNIDVSGSPNSPAENYSHYKGDRNKLAKNLKYLFKIIISMKSVPSFESPCKIKLFGIHLYSDQVYVYSLSMPMWDVFVFNLEFKFDIPVKPTLFPSTLPPFISKLSQVGVLLDNFSNKLETFLLINDYESSSSSDSDKSTFSNPKVSSKKRKHHQNN
ncbi:hypothetical protein BD408DRAFT_477119 [Parasitella parasitica]|nr:hypothetical protein BD408DRAFT_477119 [Parasitella parasitica]